MMKSRMIECVAAMAVGAVIVYCFVVPRVSAAVPVNNGLIIGDNGPCTPAGGQAGICNDNGVLSWYDTSGTVTPFSAMIGKPGPAGPAGKDGLNGVDGKDGAPGVIVGQTLALGSVSMTCPKGGKGGVQTGFSTSGCTLSGIVTGIH